MSAICIIPARIGSKRIPKKNVRDFLGRPIISYVIEEALRSKAFDEVMVSTDSEEVARIATVYGASVPFLRSEKNSGDFSGTEEVLVEVTENYAKQNRFFDMICCLYPTAVLVTQEIIERSKNCFLTNNYTSLFIAAKYNHPIQRSFKTKDNKAILNWPEFEDHRTQDLPETYYDCGCLYWLKTDNFLRSKHIFNDNTGMFVLKSSEAQDIDTNEDWLMAELKYKALRGVER